MQRYRLIPLLLASLFIFAAFSAVLIMLWSLILFIGKTPAEEIGGFPTVLWIIALALSTAFVTRMTRGGTVFPALCLGVVAAVASCFFASDGILTAGGVILKILISLLVTVAAFVITKLLVIYLLPRRSSSPRTKRRKRKQKEQVSEYTEHGTPVIIQANDDFGSFMEHKE